MEKERRVKALVIVVLVIAVLGLTIALATLSQNLTINGSAKLDASKWGLKFDNLLLVTGDEYIQKNANIKTDDNTIIENMNVKLTTPGDKVIYTVDLVNEGSINAKIDKIEKTALTEEQEKYLSFKVIKEDNEELNGGYVLGKETRIPLKIVIEFKKDITEDQLPKETSTITLSYGLAFVQTDEAVSNGIQTPTIACTTFEKKNTYFVGDEIALCNNDTGKSEDFYVISDNGDTVTALAKYNLLVGNEVEINNFEDVNIVRTDPIDTSTSGYGLQSSDARGALLDNIVWTGTIAFNKDKNSGDGYWIDSNKNLLSKYGTSYPAYVFDENSLLYEPLKNYESYLKTTLAKTSVSSSLLTYEQVTSLGCDKDNNTCEAAPSWVYETTYWLGYAIDGYSEACIASFGELYGDYPRNLIAGLRPVITISKTDL